MRDLFGATEILSEQLPDGAFLLRNTEPLGAYPQNVGTWLRDGAAAAPDRVFIGERAGDGWETWSWREAATVIDQVSATLLASGLGPDRPLAILTPKSARSGLITFAAMQVGIPVAPLSPNWSLLEDAEPRLRHALRTVQPGMIVAETRTGLERALKICRELCPSAHQIGIDTDWEALASGDNPQAVDMAFDAVTADSVGKIMFTSGSTGLPKAVQVTHGNMTSNQQAMRQMLPVLTEAPPVIVDWQPWHHCGGGCNNWHAAVANGGSYYCDPGRPTPDGIGETVQSLRALSPTIHFNVPLGYDLLFDALAGDEMLKRQFFGDLQILVYSAASMPMALWDRAKAHARRPDSSAIPMISAYGMTEMAPMHTMVAHPMEEPNQIGIPAPGCDVRLIPFVDETGTESPDRYELQARGPNIMSGYHADEPATAAAFTEDGWFRAGDLVRFVDPSVPAKGLRLDGRVVEQFKLQSGTWVSVNDVRLSLVAALQPLFKDAIIAGEGQKHVAALLVPAPDASEPESGWPAWIAARLDDLNAGEKASSRRVESATVIQKPLSVALGEVTDKGSINQRMALRHRMDEVRALFHGVTGPV